MDRKKYYKDYYIKNRSKKLEAAKIRHNKIKDNDVFKKGRQTYHKNYYELNKEKIIIRTSKNNLNAIKTNVHTRIAQLLRNRIYMSLKKNKKFFKLKEVLGCSIDELKIYLESKFKPGMSWENYSRYGWHIDHIKPCSKFDLSDPEQQKQCFHYSNLQPLAFRGIIVLKSNKNTGPLV